MAYHQLNTENLEDSRVFLDAVERCEDLEEFNGFMREHSALYVGWSDYIRPRIYEKHLTAKTIAQGCGVSESNAAKFQRMIPTKRESVIMLAMMLGLNLDETNELLTRLAKFQRLYAKNPQDAIWIYLIEAGGSPNPAKLFKTYSEHYDQLYEAYHSNFPGHTEDIPKTSVAFEQILQAAAQGKNAKRHNAPEKPDAGFDRIMIQLIPAFDAGYQKLLEYIESLFLNHERQADQALGITEQDMEYSPGKCPTVRSVTPHESFQSKPRWQDTYFNRIRELKKKRKVPERTFLIALGLHMSLTSQQINQLLEMAEMGPLCPKDRLECAIIFHLESMNLLFPVMFHPDGMEVAPEYQQTMNYSSEQAGNALPGGGLPPEIRGMVDEDDLPRESISGYLHRMLEEADISDPDEKKNQKKLLKWL